MIEIHHIAAISGNLERAIAFYTKVLGLDVVEKISHYGGPRVCHFYWNSDPSKYITLYHCPGLGRGKRGAGCVGTIRFSVDAARFNSWIDHRHTCNIPVSTTTDFSSPSPTLLLKDPDGLILQLVFVQEYGRLKRKQVTNKTLISILAIHSIEIFTAQPLPLASILSNGARCKKQKSKQKRFCSHTGEKKQRDFKIDISPTEEKAVPGTGMVHHVAFKIAGRGAFIALRKKILKEGKPCISRRHPNPSFSFYFFERDGILFELLCKRDIQLP